MSTLFAHGVVFVFTFRVLLKGSYEVIWKYNSYVVKSTDFFMLYNKSLMFTMAAFIWIVKSVILSNIITILNNWFLSEYILKCIDFCDQICIFSIIAPVFSVTWSSDTILICWFTDQETFMIMKLVTFLHIFLWKPWPFFLWLIENMNKSIYLLWST